MPRGRAWSHCKPLQLSPLLPYFLHEIVVPLQFLFEVPEATVHFYFFFVLSEINRGPFYSDFRPPSATSVWIDGFIWKPLHCMEKQALCSYRQKIRKRLKKNEDCCRGTKQPAKQIQQRALRKYNNRAWGNKTREDGIVGQIPNWRLRGRCWGWCGRMLWGRKLPSNSTVHSAPTAQNRTNEELLTLSNIK